MEIRDQISQFRDDVLIRQTKKKQCEEDIIALEEELAAIKIDDLKQANLVLAKLSQKQREISCEKLTALCTMALQYAVSPNMTSKIELATSRGKPSAKFKIVDDLTGVETEPVSGGGGGIVDVVSTALRFIIAEVWRDPIIDGPIILDEAYKHLSKDYASPIAEFLRNLSGDFGRQIIMSTHNDFIAQSANKIIEIKLDDAGRSKISYSSGI